ncbi:serine hydrolase domain-containing protein [Undibacterium sp. TJN25]|uniref:serine hydrolase domain-containing protein n=1 Tax=Undibacterium sp. TJN25 TaxID=3413056 RepID=UPI003BF38251
MNNALHLRTSPLSTRLSFFPLLVTALALTPALSQAQNAAPEITREKVERAVDALKHYGLGHKDAFTPPGIAIAIVYQDEVVATLVDGVRQVSQPEKIDSNTAFQLASVSKPLGATVMAKLISQGVQWKTATEAGKMGWDTPIQKLMPDFVLDSADVTHNVSSRITLGNLYSHRSGLPEHAGDDLEGLGRSRAEVIQRLRYIPGVGKNFEEKKYAYTNFGLTAAGVAAANAAGMSWEAASSSLLYKPLDMRNTSSLYTDFIHNPNHASGHVIRGGKWVFEKQRQPDAQSPAGGASSSVKDMAQWMRLYLADGKLGGKQYIPADALRELYSAHIDVSDEEKLAAKADASCDNAARYIYGWNACWNGKSVRLNHSGAFTMGASTVVTLLPREKLGIVVLTNSEPHGVAEALARGFIELAENDQLDARKRFPELFAEMKQKMDEAIRGVQTGILDPSSCPVHGPADVNLGRYIGTYANAYFGPFDVVRENAYLSVVMGRGKEDRFLLSPCRSNAQNGFDFYFEITGENAAGHELVQFAARNPDAPANKMIIPHLQVGELQRADK